MLSHELNEHSFTIWELCVDRKIHNVNVWLFMSYQIKICRWKFPRYRSVRWDRCLLSLGPIALFEIIHDHPGGEAIQANGRPVKPTFRFWPWFGVVLMRIAIIWGVMWLISQFVGPGSFTNR